MEDQARLTDNSSLIKNVLSSNSIWASFFTQPFTINYELPSLPLLDNMVAIIKAENEATENKSNFEEIAIIAVQHVLETTWTLLKKIIELGVDPGNIFMSGKCYSTSPLVANAIKKLGVHLIPDSKPTQLGDYQTACLKGIEAMWNAFLAHIKSNDKIKRIIVLDEGGRCLQKMPKHVPLTYPMAAIEQTRGGLYIDELHRLSIPLFNVATSAIKRNLEPPFIAEAILNKVETLLPTLNITEDTVFGIIGNGAIGSSIAKYLTLQGRHVLVYDKSKNSFNKLENIKSARMSGIREVITNAHIVFGCTGKDITEGLCLFTLITDDTTLISCTSEDKEFRSFLQEIQRRSIVEIDPLSEIKCKSNSGHIIHIAGGGFPFNFIEKTPWNVPANKIAVTQGLLLGSFVQAAYHTQQLVADGQTINTNKYLKLDPYLQKYVAENFLPNFPNYYSNELIKRVKDIDWIKENSDGNCEENNFFRHCFDKKYENDCHDNSNDTHNHSIVFN